MAIPLLAPLGQLLREQIRGGAGRAATASLTVGLALVSAAFLVAAGVVALTQAIGFAAAALVFAGGFALLALCMHLCGRALAARRAAQAAAQRSRAASDLAALTALAGSARPLLPLAAFVAAFVLARRV